VNGRRRMATTRRGARGGAGPCISSTHSAKGEEDGESPSTLIFFAAEAAEVAARRGRRAKQ